MNNVQIQGLGQANRAYEETTDFEAMTNELTQKKDTPEGYETDNSDEVFGDEEAIEMLLEQTIINETIRQMKQNQQRLEDIFNEI